MVFRRRAIEIIILLAFCLFLFIYGLGAFGLTGADEPRYAQIAREMLARHDWVTPVLYGEAWLEKPILYYWLAMVSYKIFGVSDWAARLPSAVLATLIVIGAYLFSRRLGKPNADLLETPPSPGKPSAGQHGLAGRFGLDAALMTASSVLVLAMARGASTDMPLTACFTLAMLYWYEWYESGRRWFLLAFYALMALGMLAKGPVAPFLAGLIIIAFCLAMRRPLQIARTLWLPGILLFLAVALPWYVEVQLRNPQFLRVFIFEHNLERFGTNMFRHPQPFWYYLPVTLAAVAPWSVFVCAAVVSTVRRWRQLAKSGLTADGGSGTPDALAIFLLLWAAVPILFFSFSQSKLPAYILPAVPACALLAAVYVSNKTRKGEAPKAWLIVMHALVCALLLTGALLAPSFLQKTIPGVRQLMMASVAGSLAFFAVTLCLFFRGFPVLRVITLLPALVAVAFLIRGAAPVVDATQSERPVARFLQQLGVESNETVALFHARREVEYGLAFYRNQPIPVYERQQPPANAHILVAGEGREQQLRQMLDGRKAEFIGFYRPQHLQVFAVAAANDAAK